jgi:hypothetical protein
MRTLFEEDEFPFVMPESGEIAIVGPVEESLARPWRLASQHIHKVVAIKMDYEGFRLDGQRVSIQLTETSSTAMDQYEAAGPH